LSRPDAVTPMGQLGIQGIPIDEERERANEIKTRERILAIIGNPPYKRLSEGEDETLVGRWMNEKWDDLKKPVRDAGKGGQLNTFPEFSVAFWRWAMWKLFEAENAPKKGVIAFITNRKYLTGWPYAGLRKMMRERFDRLEIIDLRGDVRAGVRGDVANDQGVFNIMVGTAICIAVADGTKPEGELAEVLYRDSWDKGVFSKKAKLDWLEAKSVEGRLAQTVEVDRDLLEDFRPAPFATGNWVSLGDVLLFGSSGVETTRDHIAYGFDAQELRDRVESMQAKPAPVAEAEYSQSRKARFSAAYREAFDAKLIRPVAYRPLNRMALYNSTNYVDWPRPALQKAWGNENLALWGMAYATNDGPATWVHTSLPDRHAFKGSTGGYAFPLYDRRRGADAHSLNPAILAALGEAYGEAVSPEDTFDAILALLSATSYTVRFAEDLEDTFPHIPFPADPALFHRAAAIGREIRGLEGFQREPAAEYRPKDFCRLRSEATGEVGLYEATDGQWYFCADETGRFDGLPPRVWEFAVSGYRVLKRWVEARAGLEGAIYWPQFRDVATRIHELLHWFDQADLVLEAVLANTLSREELGLEPVTEE